MPTVKEVGKYCFDGVSSITNVALNEGLETICDYAFRNCALTSLVVPDTVMSMGSACIGNAKQLENLTVPFVGDVRGFRTIPAYNKRLSYIFGSSGEPTNLKKLTITDETEFYEGCLSYANNDKLEELTIPFIGRKLGAYYGSSSSHFGYVFGAKKHEDNASAVPSSLRKVTITRDTVISSYAFENCGGLEHVIVSSDAISSIGNYAFKNCVGLQAFVIPDSTTRINEGVFNNCSSLKSVTIPNAVTAIGYYAFVSCDALEIVCVDKGDIDRVKGLMTGRGVSVDELQFIERDIPVRYTVDFVLGDKGVRIGGGELHQTVAYGDSAVKPVVSAETGYKLAGWDKPTDSISANTTITAIYRPTVYSISYVSTFGNVHDNPTTYTIEDEVVINSVLPFTQGKEFVGWNPSRIEKGSSGNQTVSAEWRTVSLAEGLGASNLTCESVGDARWFVTKIDGKYALQSGVTPDYGISKVSIEVRGEGTLTFTWKASTEIVKTTYIDYGAVLVDGEDVLPHIGGETAWTTRTLTIKGVGLHTIAWEYVKDEMDSGGQDCVWLKDVVWTPDVVVPTLVELGNIFGKDSEVVKYIKDETHLALFNDFLRECSVSSDADLKPAQKQYAYQSFKLKEITTAPQLFEQEPVLKIDDLELSGSNLAVTISLTAGAEAIQLAKDKLAEKIRVGSSLDSIVGEPYIVSQPSADGTSLTFKIEPPQGQQGFVKVIIE